jgi:hypothetical protein
VAVETAPVAFGLGGQFEDHGQGGDTGATSLGLPGSMTDRVVDSIGLVVRRYPQVDMAVSPSILQAEILLCITPEPR